VRKHLWRSRGARAVSMVVVIYLLFVWYQDLHSDQTEAWLTTDVPHGTWAAVFLMGLVVGAVMGTLCAPVIIDLWRAIKK